MVVLSDSSNLPTGSDRPQLEGAVKKVQAVARRRSLAARERFSHLKQQQGVTSTGPPRGLLTRPTAASRSRSRGRPLTSVQDQSTSVAKGQRGDQEEKESVATTTGHQTQLATQVLERVGRREAVITAIVEGNRWISDEELDKSVEKMRDQAGTRWDFKAKCKAREEKIVELRAVITKLRGQQEATTALFGQVEQALLRDCRAEAAKAHASERALIDGSGLRDKLERLEAERDDARSEAQALRLQLGLAESAAEQASKRVVETRQGLEAAGRERDEARSEARRLAEARLMTQATHEATGAARLEDRESALARMTKERDDFASRLELIKAELVASTERCRALNESIETTKQNTQRNTEVLELKLKKLNSELEDQREKVCRAEAEAKIASRHYEDARAELRALHEESAAARADAEGRARRASAVTRDADRLKLQAEADISAAKATALEAETRAVNSAALVRELESEAQELRFQATSNEKLAREAGAQARQLESEVAVLRAELNDYKLRTDQSGAAAEARLAELRARLEAADASRDRAYEQAALAEKRAAELTERAARATAEANTQRDAAIQATEALKAAQLEINASHELATKAQAAADLDRGLLLAAQDREHSERRERTAALAQLLALQERAENDAKTYETKLHTASDARNATQAAYEALLAALRIDLDEAEALASRRATEIEAFNLEAKQSTDLELSKARGEIDDLRRRLDRSERYAEESERGAEAKVVDLQTRLRDAEDARRQLHNTVQELRGNIRVFARVRPFLPSDKEEGEDAVKSITPIQFGADGASVTLVDGPVSDTGDDGPFAGRKPTSHRFAYDKVFGPSDGQEAVFLEVANFVQSALDGYQVCLFAYGQTGSGKTHTMQGGGHGPMRGIIPRTMDQVAAYLADKRERGWTYDLSVTYVEIYNDTVRDLLIRPEADADTKRRAANLDVRRDPKSGRTYADGATFVPVDPVADPDTVQRLLDLAARTRNVASTEMNAHSSRSHAVFTLHLNGKHNDQGLALRGALHLVDLAGSERLNRSNAVGQRMKEATHINKSLSALGSVFNALATKQKHVPFRDSKLTFLLQNALITGKSLVIVNLSPTANSSKESLQTLAFGQRLSAIELGSAQRSIQDC